VVEQCVGGFAAVLVAGPSWVFADHRVRVVEGVGESVLVAVDVRVEVGDRVGRSLGRRRILEVGELAVGWHYVVRLLRAAFALPTSAVATLDHFAFDRVAFLEAIAQFVGARVLPWRFA
jgi:hypothetical protein